jgi:cyclopropane fatty-acyl-phospholipid synthase-like methyltransferase
VGADEGYFGPAVDTLAELAGDGTAPEFAIGTGRIALPLAERGVRVVGIDNSEATLARLREKPGSRAHRGHSRQHAADARRQDRGVSRGVPLRVAG